MRPFPITVALLAAGFFSSGLLSNAAAAPEQRTPVVVELFTSEGCSSCPPADALLKQLVQTQPIAGVEIIALEQHVDYWNHLGWADPFSSATFSARQSTYADFFHDDSVYTPQMIVDGRWEFVGSDGDKAHDAIESAARAPKADVRLTEDSGAAASNGITLSVSVTHLPAAGRADNADVILAITEDDLFTHVERGENGGRSLVHYAVVRTTRLLGYAGPDGSTKTTHVPLADAWRRQHLHAIIFIQERVGRRILGAATIRLT